MPDKKEDPIAKILKYGFVVTIIFSILYYTCSEIYNATPEVSGRLSNVFSFVSSFGIIATISVYLWQRNDQKRRDKDENSKKKESIKHLIKRCVSDFCYCINKVELALLTGDIAEAINQLNKINNRNLERCLIDSKDIDFNMFYMISDLLDAINEHKDFIEKRITNGSNKNLDYYDGSIACCNYAKNETNERCRDIINY